ncbi:hypothetical protein MMC14_006456 [Varicellaria rhodocarpa]|nr:hypothetical protein [Varicellaria rhodocarpa]
MDYKGKRKGKGEASSNKRTHSEYEVDDHENLTNLGPSFIQHDIPGEDPLDIETSYVMAIDPAILETTKDSMTSQFATPPEKPSESDKPTKSKKRNTASQMKMEELVRAGRILANDELKWKKNDQINCKIIVCCTPPEVQSTTTVRYLNLTVTYESLPVAGPSSGLSRNPRSEPDIQEYLDILGPSKIESLIFEHVGIVPKGPKKRETWSNFSLLRGGEDLELSPTSAFSLTKSLSRGIRSGRIPVKVIARGLKGPRHSNAREDVSPPTTITKRRPNEIPSSTYLNIRTT